MDYGIYSSAAYLHTLEQWQSSVTQNLSASSTPGFRGQAFAVEGKQPSHTVSRQSNTPKVSMPEPVAKRNFHPAQTRQTNNPYDFAIPNGNFFALQHPDGRTIYTRDGEFQRNADGQLVSKQGYPVIGTEGNINIPPAEGPLGVATDGTLSQNGERIGALALYQFDSPDRLVALGGSTFEDAEGLAGAQLSEDPRVLQGFIEGSNINPLSEMVNMIMISRSYEAAQKVITTFDELNGKAIQTFGSR
ncbi:MAG: flagellar hook-basal body protein [Opitutales bacterium]|nr:flagellar hook-basal body protein [Opitutales bacterium]